MFRSGRVHVGSRHLWISPSAPLRRRRSISPNPSRSFAVERRIKPSNEFTAPKEKGAAPGLRLPRVNQPFTNIRDRRKDSYKIHTEVLCGPAYFPKVGAEPGNE